MHLLESFVSDFAPNDVIICKSRKRSIVKGVQTQLPYTYWKDNCHMLYKLRAKHKGELDKTTCGVV